MMRRYWGSIVRIAIGGLFLFSGFEKLTQPYQNFQFVVDTYDIIPATWSMYVALILPWMELVVGAFLMLGYWLWIMSRLTWLMVSAFLVVVGQAMIRQLPIDECGCFGEAFSIPMPTVFALDLFMCLFLIYAMKRDDVMDALSVDRVL